MFYGNRTALLLAKHSIGTPLLILKGPEGLGKSITAKALARKSLCVGTKEKDCNCESCRKLKSGNHPDFFYISLESISKDKKDLEKSIKISDIAFINQEVRTYPLVSPYKVFLLDDADAMTNEAQTRLLKTIEDTQPFVKFLIVTHGNLLPTILSRGIFINFSPLSDEEIQEFISNQTEDKRTREILTASSSGSPGKAVCLLKEEGFIDSMKGLFDCITGSSSVSTILSSVGLLKEKDSASIMNRSNLFVGASLMCLSRFFVDLLKVKMGSQKIFFESYLGELNRLEKQYSVKGINNVYAEIEKSLEDCNNNTLTQEKLILLFDKIVRGEQLSETA